MGGTQAAFDANNQYTKSSKELDKVTFFIHFPDKGNLILFDLDKLHKSLSEKVVGKLKENGIRYEETFVDGGGGGFDTLWQIFQTLWENRELLTFFISLFGYAKTAYKMFIDNTVENLKPLLDIAFFIEADSDVSKMEKSEVDFIFSRRLANLLVVAGSIQKQLNEELGAIYLNVSVEAKLNTQHTSVSVVLPRKMDDLEKINPLLRVIKDLRIKANHFTTYKLLPFGIIKRDDAKLIKTKDSLDTKHAGTYYLLFSTRIVSDYIR